MERAPRRPVDQARRLPWNGSQPVLVGRQARQALHQPDRVGMARRGEDRVDVAELDDLPGVHDDHAVGHLGDQPEIVRDQDRRGVRLVLCRLQHLEDLRLDGHVERRRRLVGDQQRRLIGDRHRDHRALPHAAGELVRVLVVAALGLRDADGPQELDAAPVDL